MHVAQWYFRKRGAGLLEGASRMCLLEHFRIDLQGLFGGYAGHQLCLVIDGLGLYV